MELVFFLQKLVHFFDQRLVLLVETFPCLILFECNLIFNLRLKGEELLLLGLMDAFCDRPLLSFLVRVLATWVGLDSEPNHGKGNTRSTCTTQSSHCQTHRQTQCKNCTALCDTLSDTQGTYPYVTSHSESTGTPRERSDDCSSSEPSWHPRRSCPSGRYRRCPHPRRPVHRPEGDSTSSSTFSWVRQTDHED